MKTNSTIQIPQPLKAFGIAAIAITLCLCTAAPSAQTLIAYAEPEAASETATPSAETTETFLGWYLCGKALSISGGGGDRLSMPVGDYGYNKAGDLVFLPQIVVDAGLGRAYIDATEKDGFLSTTGLKLYDTKIEPPLSNLVWWALYEVSPVVQTVEPDTSENKKAEMPQPEVERVPNETNTNDPSVAPDVPQVLPEEPKPDMPTQPENASNAPEPSIIEQPSAETPSEIFSIQCRESETSAKVAELEAQGYEIVRVEKLPRWGR